jgi:N6-adenosine-specific RNA methylase IME4
MLRTALQLAARGLPVFPCTPGGKTPACTHGCLDGTTDVVQIQSWWRSNSQFNIGVACGHVPGAAAAIFALDLDGGEAETALKRGDEPTPPENNRPPSVLYAPRREHSRKPDEVYVLIERTYPELPKIELFERARRPGWDAWGNEVPQVESWDEMWARPFDYSATRGETR